MFVNNVTNFYKKNIKSFYLLNCIFNCLALKLPNFLTILLILNRD